MGAGQSKQSQPPVASATATNATAASNDVTNSISNAAIQNPSTNDNDTAASIESSKESGGCPMKNADGTYRIMPGFASLFGKMGGHPPVDASKINVSSGESAAAAAAVGAANNDGNAAPSQTQSTSSSSGCPVKHDNSSSRSWNILQRGGSGPGSDNLQTDNSNSACPVKSGSSSTQQQYDVYSRPLPMDPTNNMPITNPTTLARNSLPSPNQNVALPTERVSSTIPKGNSETTWTYPSPQMFYNALARKGKLDEDTKEEDMISVVAIHNCMNEGTWGRVLQWEKVLGPSGHDDASSSGGPSLTKFMGRPTDLSPKAFFKHYILNHPLPFDRHDWTVTRTNESDGSSQDVRYVIDYYHNDAAANDEEGSGLPSMNEGIGQGGKLQSLVVDVRPAVDSLSEVWGRMVDMPLARRGCRSVLECVLFKGHGSGPKSEFEPLPLRPSESLKESMGESQVVWENIQRDALMKKGVGAKDDGKACASDSLEGNDGKGENVASAAENGRQSIEQNEPKEEQITKSEATNLATTFSQILTQCQESKAALQTCSSDEECQKAFMGMTVCAGQHMCPLQHSSLVDSLTSHTATGAENEEMAEAKINTALDVLGECVANYDSKASVAKWQFPEVFDGVLKQQQGKK
mmetsp:Transcript_15702/g.34010  ORF Transcript_15702/g.34010 Transcript_15702/m.34010 type:complete len:635 (+) Transcript_15702:66-1970(+)|eukprot:CAMPEP_0172325372 /NCGR_PEP_ID=MMETSP1058-20130122/53836_1 /TAXON_ID=83371 /ORGANISM="Detonula confervacea, Strain CCMP 353" /LENGTH=634 /DNA_ID=CAMNT_0013041895 /DNA_START=64 /DNA_END=1968 /DNA_ORIENTATION=-